LALSHLIESPNCALASSSVNPNVAVSDWEKTAEGTFLWLMARGLFSNSLSAKALRQWQRF
jgi:hypothetical protein